MAMYKCPVCNKKYAVEDAFPNTFTETSITCSACGSKLEIMDDNYTEETYDSTEEIHDDNIYMGGLMREQLKTLKSIEKMTRFFYRLTWVGIVFSIIYWLFVLML